MNQPFQFGTDSRSLRDALGEFATGVAVVTARTADGAPVGVTINSFASVSLEPPLVLWSLGLQSPTRPAFEACSRYAVNILAADQVEPALGPVGMGIELGIAVPGVVVRRLGYEVVQHEIGQAGARSRIEPPPMIARAKHLRGRDAGQGFAGAVPGHDAVLGVDGESRNAQPVDQGELFRIIASSVH